MNIKLYVYPVSKDAGILNFSPFCTKTEAYLRLLGRNYERVFFTKPPSCAPKGKLPFVKIDDVIISDSHFIEEALRNNYDLDLDKNFCPSDQAIIFSFKKMIEEYLYWCTVNNRWLDQDNALKTKAIFFGKVPWPIREIMWKLSTSKVKKNINGHGLGTHRSDEILSLAQKCLKSLSEFLDDKLYFMGDEYSSLDASAYGILEQIYHSGLNPQIKEIADKYENLKVYTKNFNDYFTKLKML